MSPLACSNALTKRASSVVTTGLVGCTPRGSLYTRPSWHHVAAEAEAEAEDALVSTSYAYSCDKMAGSVMYRHVSKSARCVSMNASYLATVATCSAARGGAAGGTADEDEDEEEDDDDDDGEDEDEDGKGVGGGGG